MANIPTPRSYAQALGDLLDVFLSKLGFTGLKVGGPLLSIFESAAQSDVRSSSDFFALLAAITLKNAKGPALDRIGADEGVIRIAAIRASTTVILSDTSFTKVVSRVYQGKPAPVAGSNTIYVVDGSQFTATGKIYIGRDTANIEGPLNYSAIVKDGSGAFWTITLTGTTTKFHNLAESVTLAQGGDRTVSAGQTVSTQQSGSSVTVSFSTVDTVTVLDGENTLTGVRVVAQQPGVSGNVPVNSLVTLTPTPFTGAAVTNPLPVSNGSNIEDDDAYRERIRAVRASRTKGTDLSIKVGVLGLGSSDESSRIASANVVVTKGEPTVLYIDDGTGYEEKSAGLSFETIIDSAVGGEQRLQLTGGRPLAKAFVQTTTPGPFSISNGCTLAVLVGGVRNEITFNATQFRDVTSATAFECVAAINSTYTLAFAARTVNNGQSFVVFAKSDTNEDVQIVAPTSGTDANQFFGFPTGRVDSLRLFKNDKLLYKDGLQASLSTTDHGLWSPNLAAGDTFIYTVDGTIKLTWTLANQDFIDAATGYTQVAASNSLAAWAAVFNAKAPGITATVAGNTLLIASNLGRDSRASVVIDPTSSLVASKGVFSSLALTSTGRSSDYSLDRNLAQIKLVTPLVASDRLTAATPNTRAYVQSSSFSTATVPAAQTANFWFVVDGAAQTIQTGVTAQTTLTITSAAIAGGVNSQPVYRVTINSGVANTFLNVKPGDWLIVWDPAFIATSVAGIWRIADKTGNSDSLYIETDVSITVTAAPTNGGVIVVRSGAVPQKLSVAAGIYSPDSLVTQFNSTLVGATASVFHTNQVRVTTATFGSNGDISFLTQDGNAQLLFPFVLGAAVNASSHIAFLESANSDYATTPTFDSALVDSSVGTALTFSTTSTATFRRGGRVVWLRPTPNGVPARDHANRGSHTVFTKVTGGTTATVASLNTDAVPQARLYSTAHYAISPDDTLSVVVDGDVFSKNYLITLGRPVKPNSTFTTWAGNTVALTESDGVTSMTVAFPATFDFSDFLLHLQAKTITSPPADADATVHAVVWRSLRYGRDGEKYRISYTNPTAPSQAFAVSSTPGDFLDVSIQLPSGAARSVTMGPKLAYYSVDGAGFRTITYFSGIRASTTPGGSNTFTATIIIGGGGMPAVITDHQFQVGDVVMISGGNNCPTGLANVTARTATTVTVQYQGGLTTVAGAAENLNITQTLGSAITVPLSLSAVLVGDIITVSTLTKLSANATVTGRVSVVGANGNYFQVQVRTLGSNPNASYAEIVSPSYVQFYPIDTTQTNTTGSPNLATRVNALNNPYVSAALPAYSKSGIPQTGQPVTIGTFDDFVVNAIGDGNGYVMADGSRYVSGSSIVSSQYQFTINVGAAGGGGGLWTTDADWANETAKLSPVGAASFARYLNQPSVTGFQTSGEVKASSRAGKLQIASATVGSDGTIQTLGGSANSVLAPVFGYALPGVTGCYVQTRASDSVGLLGGQWVAVQATQSMPKLLNWTASTNAAITAGGFAHQSVLTLSVAGTIAKYAGAMTVGISGKKWQIEQQGRYVCFFWVDAGAPTSFSGVKEGDFVRLRTDLINVGTASAVNMGLFRVIRVNYHASSGGNDPARYMFWVENPNAVEEVSITGLVEFYDADSILPGDSIVINTGVLGAGNQGTWTVLDLGTVNGSGQVLAVTLSGDMAIIGATALGTAVPLIQAFPATPLKLVKQIGYVAPTGDGTHMYVSFTTQDSYQRINSSAGCYVTPLDKLGFGTSMVPGLDAYHFNTGLIAEANKVIYGLGSDPDTYPGILTAGAQLNISGPLVRRIQIGLLLRVGQGLDRNEIAAFVRSGVATVVNSAGVGQAVDLAAIVRAARDVDGVTAVTITSPTFGIGNDLIAVQPYEKPMVLNLDTDVLVSFTGA